MSWSLALENGDLALNNNGMAVVSGEAKLLQDLTCYLLTPLGSNDAHTDYGSLLNGGVENGVIYPPIYTDLNDSATQSEIISEIQRVTTAYQNMQLVRAKADQIAYGKSTLSKGEVLLSVDSINGTVQDVTVNINVEVSTANGTTANLNVPISG